MRHGWVYLYESSPASTRFGELVDHFEHGAISLADPGTGRVIRLTHTGEQISSSRQDILRECTNSTEVHFNLYLAPSDNLFCSIVKLSDVVVRESYSLDGKTEEQSQRVIKTLVELFSRRAGKGVVLGLIADRYAELHRDFHWDDFVLGEAPTPPDWPLAIGFSNSFAKLSVIPKDLYVRETRDNCVLFRKTEAVNS